MLIYHVYDAQIEPTKQIKFGPLNVLVLLKKKYQVGKAIIAAYQLLYFSFLYV